MSGVRRTPWKRCGERPSRVIACIEDPAVINQILAHLAAIAYVKTILLTVSDLHAVFVTISDCAAPRAVGVNIKWVVKLSRWAAIAALARINLRARPKKPGLFAYLSDSYRGA